MRATFRSYSLRRKLVVALLVSIVPAMFLSFLSFALLGIYQMRNVTIDGLRTLAESTAIQSMPTLIFADSKAATETLDALRASSLIVGAQIHDGQGRLFASYQRGASGGSSAAGSDASTGAEEVRDYLAAPLWATRIALQRPILSDGEVIGSVRLQADLSGMWLQIAYQVAIAGALTLLSFAVALYIGLIFDKLITEPVLRLAEATQTVTRTRDYTLRVTKYGNDELGTLFEGFNAMLDEIKARDEQLKRNSERLEVQVEERTEELNKARKAAEAASIAKSQFLANMSHEIRTPLNGLLGMLELVGFSRLDDEQRESLEIARESGRGLVRIIDEILDFSKIEAGKLDLEQLPVTIAKIVEGVSDTLAPLAHKKRVELITFCDPKIPETVGTDPVRLRQILFNLAGNAVKFTGTEAGKAARIVIRADLAQVSDSRAAVRFRVVDNGIGMSAETVSKLFQPFTQAESSTTRRFGGTGLGLSICARLVALMGGRIAIDSEPGRGSTFSVDLDFPLVSGPASGERRFDLSELRVVVIAAADDMEEILSKYLADGGAQVRRAERIDDAIDEALTVKESGVPFVIVVVDAENDPSRIRALQAGVAARPELAGTRFVVIQRGRRRAARIAGPATVTLDANAMHRASFMRAVAIAAGRASPEREPAQQDPLITVGHAPTVEEAQAAGRLVLVAEDNPINQKVILRQLKLLGYAAEVADDGAAALRMWQSKHYGILLTDCHMPEMDGFELTAALRKAETSAGRHTPIIAITANALQGEAERCHAAGMDAYLAKPIELALLQDMLTKWLPARTESAQANATPKVAVNPQALAQIVGSDPAVIVEFLQDFVPAARKGVTDIRAAFDKRSAEAIAAQAHKLKSAARTVGAGVLADLCEQLERAGKETDWTTLDAASARLEPEFAAVERFIQAYTAPRT